MAGGFAILGRLHLTGIAVGFWLAFAAGIGVLAASGHVMTAAWHVGPIVGFELWWTLVTSPEVLVFLFFMITDPRTIPSSAAGRRAYAIGVGLLATLLIAPFTSEFAAKVAVLAALFIVCVARPILLLGETRLASRAKRVSRPPAFVSGALALLGAVAFVGLVVAAGIPARPEAEAATAPSGAQLPQITVVASDGRAPLDRRTSRRIARDVVADLRSEAEALRQRDLNLAEAGATGEWLAALWQQIDAAEAKIDVPTYDVRGLRLRLEPGDNQGPPTIIAQLRGSVVVGQREPEPFLRRIEVVLERGRYRIARSQGGFVPATTLPPAGRARPTFSAASASPTSQPRWG